MYFCVNFESGPDRAIMHTLYLILHAHAVVPWQQSLGLFMRGWCDRIANQERRARWEKVEIYLNFFLL